MHKSLASPNHQLSFQELSEEEFPINHRNGEYAAAGMNQGLLRLSSEESGIVAQAKSVLAWHEK